MKTLYTGLCRILMALCLIGQPWQPIATAFAESGDDTAASTSGDIQGNASGAASAPQTDENTAPLSKQSSVIMRGVVLPKTSLTMDFQDADVRDVLHLLAMKSGLNIIYGADVTGPVSVHLDRVPFDQAFQTILTLKSLVALPMGPRIIRVISSVTLNTEQSQATTFTRVFRFNYADAAEAKKPIDAIRSAAGRKGVSTVDAKTNSLILTDTVEGLKEVEELIPVLDKKPQQVDIESKVVEVTLNSETSYGISWSFADSAHGNNSYGSTSGGTSQSNFGNAASPTGSNEIVVPNPPGTPITGGTGVNLAAGNAAADASQAGFSFLHSEGAYLLSAQLTALATQNRVKILSTPHIVTTNNQEAEIQIISKFPYITTTLAPVVAGAGATATQTTVATEDAGVTLTVTPIVNADRRITLKVHPVVSYFGLATFVGGPPEVFSREAKTTVLLRDGDTIAIGGLISEQITKAVTGVPFLMNIPILGYLFKSTDDQKQRTELIVFLTPKIAAE